MRLIHVLEWLGVYVLLADQLERLRVHRYAFVFWRSQSLNRLFCHFHVFKIGAHDFCPVFRFSFCCRWAGTTFNLFFGGRDKFCVWWEMILEKISEFIETDSGIAVYINSSENSVNFILNQIVSMLFKKVSQICHVYKPFIVAVYRSKSSLDRVIRCLLQILYQHLDSLLQINFGLKQLK